MARVSHDKEIKMSEVQTELVTRMQKWAEILFSGGLYWRTPIFSNEYDPNLE